MRQAIVTTDTGTYELSIPNSVMRADDFYVSYNDTDTDIYGCVTTALVLGNMDKFYILKGDHRRQYKELVTKGRDACMAYYKDHIAESHNFSDKLP